MNLKQIFVLLFFGFLSNTLFSQVFPSSIVGHWTFDDTSDLTHASVGNDLVLVGNHTFLPGPANGDTAVSIGSGSYYICNHGIAANGGGTLVNEYSIMFDFMITDPMVWHCFYQTNTTNGNDGDVFINTTGNIGVSLTGYTGYSVQPGTWHRLVVSVDLGSSFKYYVDGHLILNGTNQLVDGRHSLELSSLLFFADDDGEDNMINISQIALFDTFLSESEVLQMGGFTNSNIKPYLQTPTPTSMYVSWNCYDNGSTKVEYGTTPLLGNVATGNFDNISTNRWHTVKLNGLQPATRYYYRCISGIDTSAVYPFRTPNDYGDSNGKIRFAVIGDSQTNVGKATAIADTMLNTFIDLYGVNWYDSVSLVFHSGDIMGNGSVIGSYQSEYFIPFSKISCSVPFMVSIGNHVGESTSYYSFVKYEDFSDYAISNPLCEKYYSFYLGNCQFISLNTNGLYNNTLQTNWLTQKLNESDANNQCDFVFSFSHQPGESELWPDGNSSYVWNTVYGELKSFPKVVMHSTGHSHNYERAVIKSTHGSNWDFRTVLSGGGGGDLDRWGMYANQTDYLETQKTIDHYNYILVDDDKTLKKCVTSMYSLGNPDKPLNNVILDQWHRIIDQPAPSKPTAVSPDVFANATPTLVASQFSGIDSLMSSEFQLTGKYDSWSNSIIDTYRNSENYYGVTSLPSLNPINLNSGIDLTSFLIPSGLLIEDSSYKWRIRYRDHNVRWSEWSDSASFVVLSTKLDQNYNEYIFEAIPNPFKDEVKIKISLPEVIKYSCSIIDSQGKKVKEFSDILGCKGENIIYWDGRDSLGNKVNSGVYICEVRSENFRQSLKLIFENK